MPTPASARSAPARSRRPSGPPGPRAAAAWSGRETIHMSPAWRRKTVTRLRAAKRGPPAARIAA